MYIYCLLIICHSRCFLPSTLRVAIAVLVPPSLKALHVYPPILSNVTPFNVNVLVSLVYVPLPSEVKATLQHAVIFLVALVDQVIRGTLADIEVTVQVKVALPE